MTESHNHHIISVFFLGANSIECIYNSSTLSDIQIVK